MDELNNKELTPNDIIELYETLRKGEESIYIKEEGDWDRFYEWVESKEGINQWKLDLDLDRYIKNWWIINNIYPGYDRI
jgi:hypothetical protein